MARVAGSPVVLAGVDVGTTNCKFGVYALDGTVLATRRRPTPPDASGLGGPSRGRTWMYVKAHVLPGPLRRLGNADAACAGAAMLAGRAIGLPAPAPSSERLPRDDSQRYDTIYRDFLSHAQEVA